jgi:putative transposase
MSNHVHMLLTPDEAGAVSRLMHTFARNYAGLFNGRHGRTGTLWEGRYKACLVDSGHYFLACSRYIELNPVRAWMVAQPDDHAWSSYGANAVGRFNPLVTPHPEYVALGADPAARSSAYRALFADALPDDLVEDIRRYLQQQKALGTDRFRSWVEARTGRFAGVRPVGRPPVRPNCP